MKTNRDLYALIVVALWLILNILSVVIIGDCFIINNLFILFWIVTLYFDRRNKCENNFHKWLKQNLKMLNK